MRSGVFAECGISAPATVAIAHCCIFFLEIQSVNKSARCKNIKGLLSHDVRGAVPLMHIDFATVLVETLQECSQIWMPFTLVAIG